jgi:tight adherence protein C
MGIRELAMGVGVAVGLAMTLILYGLTQSKKPETLRKRLERLTASLHPLEEAELEQPMADRVLKPWFHRQVQAAGRLAPGRNMEKVRENLLRAGYPYGLTVLNFMGVKLLAGMTIGIGVLALFALTGSSLLPALLLAGVLGIIGFLLPDFWLGSQVKRRQKEIVRGMPDALDMLTICVDAGAGLDSAMLKISQKWRNAIATEFGKVVAEIRIGMTRREALQNMANRANVPDLSSFVAVLLQADQFGLSIATVLHTQSEQMRARRWQRAEEEARKVPTKLLFPLVFMVFPAMLAVTIGPAIPVLLKTFASLGK